MDLRWAAILPERDPLDAELTGLPENKFVIYDDSEKIGVTVLERRLSAEHARRNRLRWNTNDIGRIRGQIADTIGYLGITTDDLTMSLTAAVRVGDADKRSNSGKFALVPEATDPAAALLVQEHELVVEGLSGVFAKFRYPYSDYVPKLTVGRIYRGAEPEQVNACAAQLTEMLEERPLTISLDPVVFFAHQEL